MTITHIDNRIQIDCDSEVETVRVYSVVVAMRILSGGSLDPYRVAILSDLDSLSKALASASRTERRKQARIEELKFAHGTP